jgi:hypothetical protein
MRHLYAAAACILLLTVPGAARAQLAGGSHSRYQNNGASGTTWTPATSCIQTITGMKGKSGRILVITSTVTDDNPGCQPNTIYLQPQVSGVLAGSVIPAAFFQMDQIGGTCIGSHTAQFWIDINSAGLVGVPLTICMAGSTTTTANYAIRTSAIQEVR